MPALSALLFGSTGATGSLLLQELLASPAFHRIGEYGRRVTASNKITVGREKLEQKVIDYEDVERTGLRDGKWDVVFITIGVTRKLAGNAETFDRVNREYVVKAARAAKSHDPSHRQRLVFISAMLASHSSLLSYLRIKASAETELAQLGYNDFIIVRPGFFGEVHREVEKPMELILSPVFKAASYISDQLYVPVPRLVNCLRIVGEIGGTALPPELVWVRIANGIPFVTLTNKSILTIGCRDTSPTTFNL